MKPYVTKEQIRAAKAVNTLAFLLRHQSEQFKRVGRTEYAHCGHDSLKVSSNLRVEIRVDGDNNISSGFIRRRKGDCPCLQYVE